MPDERTMTVRAFDDAVWHSVMLHRSPFSVSKTLRSRGITNAHHGADALLREVDPADVDRTAGLDLLDPEGAPLEPIVIEVSLAYTLRYSGGMSLGDDVNDGH